MRYPEFIKENATIGVVAPSFGISGIPYFENYLNAKNSLIDMGFNIVECPSLYNLIRAQSNSPEIRAKELMDFYIDDSIDLLWSCAGGELMNEILPYIDFDMIKSLKPKWFIGYSDNTCFIYPLATRAGIASIYGMTISEYNTLQSKDASNALLRLLTGKQKMFEQFLDDHTFTIPHGNMHIEGRLLGGCIEVITNLLQTRFDQTQSFKEHENDPIILYLEAYEFNSLGVKRVLWQLNEIGYLSNIKGIIIGKLRNDEPVFDISISEALADLNLDLSIIYNVEVGHTYPTMPFVNGAYAKISVINSKFSIEYDFTR